MTSPRLLHVEASPRGERSASHTVANAFLKAWRDRHPDAEIDMLLTFDERGLNGLPGGRRAVVELAATV